MVYVAAPVVKRSWSEFLWVWMLGDLGESRTRSAFLTRVRQLAWPGL